MFRTHYRVFSRVISSTVFTAAGSFASFEIINIRKDIRFVTCVYRLVWDVWYTASAEAVYHTSHTSLYTHVTNRISFRIFIISNDAKDPAAVNTVLEMTLEKTL